MPLTNRLSSPPDNPIADLALPIVRAGLNVPDLGVASIQLASLKGRAIVLFILGIDCGTCKHVARQLSGLHYEYGDDVSIVGVCVQNGCEERFAEFDPGSEFAFPLTHCPTRELCPALGIPRATWLFFPTMIFIDQEQKLRGLFVGGDSFFEDFDSNTRAALDSLLANSLPLQDRMEVTA